MGRRRAVLLDDPPAALGVAQRGDLLGQRGVGDLLERRAQGDRVDRGLEALQHADRARGDLGAHRQAVGDRLGHPRRHLPPAVGHLHDLLHGHRQRAAGALDERPHQRHLLAGEVVVLAEVGVGDHLHDAAAGLAHRADERHQLVLAGEAGAERQAVAGAVGVRPAGGEPDGAGLDAGLHGGGHGHQLLGGRELHRVGAALTHHVGPQRGVRDVRADVDGVLAPGQRVEVVGERLPVPREALGQRRAGDVLDALEHADQPVVLVVGRVGRGEARRRSCPSRST